MQSGKSCRIAATAIDIVGGGVAGLLQERRAWANRGLFNTRAICSVAGGLEYCGGARWSCLVLSALLVLYAVQAASTPLAADPARLVASARTQIGVTTGYDPEYRTISYPGGDVPRETGVCCDVLIRALRDQGTDLQTEVHEDMRANFSRYPRQWGLKTTDPSIDHRRVPNLRVFLDRRGCWLPVTRDRADYRLGDIVTWNLSRGGGIPHIGIVSDRATPDGTPLILHNIGRGAQEEDILFKFEITGHYRLPKPAREQLPTPRPAAVTLRGSITAR